MNKLYVSIIMSAILLAGGSAFAEKNKRIINGYESNTNTPWMVSLSDSRGSSVSGSFCGAALISESWIITAAHCVIDYISAPDALRVSYGSRDLTSPDLKSQIPDAVIVNENYDDKTVQNDIALIHIPVPVTGITPLQIATAPFAGSTATVFGWGYLSRPTKTNPEPAVPTVLHAATIPVQDDATCSAAYENAYYPDVMFCAGRLSSSAKTVDGVDSCYGDSGGPLVATVDGVDTLIGTVSWGLECASNTSYGVYTRISNLARWIAKPKILPPFQTKKPQIVGKSVVGSRLTCQTGPMSGDAITGEKYVWIDFESGRTLSHSKVLSVKPSYQNKTVQCSVTVSNVGGETEATSAITYRITGQKVIKKFRPSSPFLLEAEVRCSSSTCRMDFQTAEDISQISALFADARCKTKSCQSNHRVRAHKSTENGWVLEWFKSKYATPNAKTKIQVILNSLAVEAYQIAL